MKSSAKKLSRALLATLAAGLTLAATDAFANHPVYVEGELDFDDDGRLGTAEDNDNDPTGFPVFGTIAGALGNIAGTAGGNQNARVTIVTSGRFREQVNVTGVNGNVTIEAAPGVEATIDAVASGDPAGSLARQGTPGIIIDAAATRMITLRNLVVRNWTNGIEARNASRVIIEDCRIEHNLNFGIVALGTSRVTINKCSVTGTGFRVGSASAVPVPGIGISYQANSNGRIFNSLIAGSFADGVQRPNRVKVEGLLLSDNGS